MKTSSSSDTSKTGLNYNYKYLFGLAQPFTKVFSVFIKQDKQSYIFMAVCEGVNKDYVFGGVDP